MFYSKSTGGFYDPVIHGDNIPSDAKEITAEAHAELLDGQAAGQMIVANSKGLPVLADRPTYTAEQLAAIATLGRAAAYLNESDPLFFKVQRGEAAQDDWLNKIAEIKARYPK